MPTKKVKTLFGEWEVNVGLTEKFGVPPFSVLDTKQGHWQKRRGMWLEKTGNLSETRDGDFGKLGGSKEGNVLDKINDGTSNFDPVLAELMYKWFCIEGGKILDPFGGEQTKGVVSSELGFKYYGVEFRKDQVDYNNSIMEKNGYDARYFHGDSNNISKIITERGFDLCFTSPPYYDLEVYSKEDMSALGTYREFMGQYLNIFKQCVDMLADESFLIVKVADIRNKKTGAYRGFVADNIRLFKHLGLHFYNDVVLLNSIGTGAFRANNTMRNRKLVKLHQNVLVFFKGDMKKIGEKFGGLDGIEI